MTVAELTTIIFAILYIIEVISNYRLKKILREFLEEDKVNK